MPKRTGRPVVLCLTACIILTGSCKGITSDGCLIGPCFRGPVKQVPRVAFVVGLPDSLVSTDPANQIGLLRVSDSLTLRYVMPLSGATGKTLEQWACDWPSAEPTAVRWGLSDSSVASITQVAPGAAMLRARASGRFTVLTTVSQTLPPEFWNPYVVACPSGRELFTIQSRAP